MSPASFRHAHCSITFTPGGGGGVLGNRLATARVFAGVRKLESDGSPPFASGAERSPAPAASEQTSREAPPPPPRRPARRRPSRPRLLPRRSRASPPRAPPWAASSPLWTSPSPSPPPRAPPLVPASAAARLRLRARRLSPASAASVASPPPPPRGFDPRSPPFAAEGVLFDDADSPFTAAPAPPLVVASSDAVPEGPRG